MAWDFKAFPELPTSQFGVYYFESPHKQITSDFFAKVEEVHDGDTITISTDFRDFNFPVRLADIDAPELGDKGGAESQSWLESQVLGEEVLIKIDPFNRVGKFGRLIGDVTFIGLSMSEQSKNFGFANTFGQEVFI